MTLLPTGEVAGINAHNLQALVQDMGIKPGHHQVTYLHRWYAGMCEEAGLPVPTKKRFGLDLKALGYRASIQRREGKMARCWFISARAWRDPALSTGQSGRDVPLTP